jgi:nucleoside-diphosphate-sugar epimerase
MPVNENVIPKPNNPYALSKHMAENLCNFYSKYKNIEINIFRPFNVYGFGQDKRFLIPEIMSQVMNNNPVEVNTFKPKRDYIYIDDLVDGLISGMNSFNGLEVYNLGSGVSISVEQVINTIIKQANSEVTVTSRNIERDNEINDVIADISKARKLLSWSPKISFDNGIKNIIKRF